MTTPQHRQANPAPSSPLAGDITRESKCQALADFLCQAHPRDPQRREALQDATNTIVIKMALEVEQLRQSDVL